MEENTSSKNDQEANDFFSLVNFSFCLFSPISLEFVGHIGEGSSTWDSFDRAFSVQISKEKNTKWTSSPIQFESKNELLHNVFQPKSNYTLEMEYIELFCPTPLKRRSQPQNIQQRRIKERIEEERLLLVIIMIKIHQLS